MPRSQWLESKKQKVADGHLGCIVGLLLINADDDMAAFQDFLGVLQEGDKCLLRTAIGHLGWTNMNVESPLPQYGVPSVVLGGLVGDRGRHHTW